jgi:tyrosine-protein phosphatase SIW14
MEHASSATALFRPRYFQILTSIFMLGFITQPIQAGSKNSFAVEIDNFGQINPHYYRGAQPDLDGYRQLKQLGVKAVINLRDDPMVEEARWADDHGMQYFNIPLSTKKPATAEETNYFLALVNDPQNWPVYVHCQGGKHRAGEMTAIYRIAHDSWTADQAYKEMKQYKFYSFPFQGSLRDYVYQYYDSFKRTLAEAALPADGTASKVNVAGAASN